MIFSDHRTVTRTSRFWNRYVPRPRRRRRPLRLYRSCPTRTPSMDLMSKCVCYRCLPRPRPRRCRPYPSRCPKVLSLSNMGLASPRSPSRWPRCSSMVRVDYGLLWPFLLQTILCRRIGEWKCATPDLACCFEGIYSVRRAKALLNTPANQAVIGVFNAKLIATS